MTPPYTPETLPQACCGFTGPFEGNILWPYLDDDGNVTAGIGHLIRSVTELMSIFGIDPLEAQEAWINLKGYQPGRLPSYYESATSLRLTPDQSAALFASDMPKYITAAVSRITGFWELDGNAQVAANDVFYNAGYFSKMCAALSRKDYVTASLECSRKVTTKENPVPGGISVQRNEATIALMRSAVGVVS